MGIFDFVQDAGKTVNASMDLSRELAKHDLNVEDLDLKYEQGVISVGGKVKTQEEREKVILALGNVKGVAKVDESLSVEGEEAEADMHTVKAGESLSKIAKKYYGDPMKYTEIFEANKPMLESPDNIYPGQVLRIPKL